MGETYGGQGEGSNKPCAIQTKQILDLTRFRGLESSHGLPLAATIPDLTVEPVG